MDAHRITGAVKELAGSVQEGVGSITGDRSTQFEGAARKAGGRIEQRYGEMLDRVRVAVREQPLLAIAAAAATALAIVPILRRLGGTR